MGGSLSTSVGILRNEGIENCQRLWWQCEKDLLKYLESIIMRHLHLLQSSRRSEQSSQSQLETGGQSICSISTVFLNGKLDGDEEVFMEQPPGYEDSNRIKYCLKLCKSIYGLKQAGRKWYEIVCRTLANLGLKRSEADQAVFYAHIGKEIIILAIHVDEYHKFRTCQLASRD
jgi:hypothetical protein